MALSRINSSMIGAGDVSNTEHAYLNSVSSNVQTQIDGAGKVLQVIQTHDTTARSQSLSANTRANISGLTATITPSATSSKILVRVRWSGELSIEDNQDLVFGIKRDTTDVGLSTATGSSNVGIAGLSQGYFDANYATTQDSCFYEYLDSPSSTSAISFYGTALSRLAGTLYTNRTVTDGGSDFHERLTSTITLMEIGA